MTTKQYQALTYNLIEELKKGRIPWEQPWFSLNHRNIVTNNPYTGINPLLLSAHSEKYGYKSTYWGSYDQVKTKHLKSGFKKAWIVFAKNCEWKKENKETGEEERKSGFVYNIYQLINGDFFDCPEIETDNEKIAKPEDIKSDYIKRENITYIEKGSRACYSPIEDKITLPELKTFKTSTDYYQTFFHEAVHSTGNSKRLNREEVTSQHFFGSHDYSKEELTAELGSVYLMKNCNLEPNTKNSIAYLQSWLKALENNPDWIVRASGKAQKATDYILNIKN